MYENFIDQALVDLIFASEDRLDQEYIAEVKNRRYSLVPLFCSILKDEANYQWEDERFWAVIHAVHILGILGDPSAIDALLTASQYCDEYDIDWIWESLPECYLRIGLEAIPKIKGYIWENRSQEFSDINTEMLGLWNLWTAYEDLHEEIEDFFIKVLKDPVTDREVRANIIADFAQLHRLELKPLFEEFYEKGEVHLTTLTQADMDYFFDQPIQNPGFRYDLDLFYDPEEIERRQKRWEKEEGDSVQRDIDDYILNNLNRIGRNDPCPCGSGKKFKKCHLRWAEEEMKQRKAQDLLLKNGMPILDEREAESDLRRILAKKDQTHLFSELKQKALEAAKNPDGKFLAKSFLLHFNQIISQIEFEDTEERQAFVKLLMEYFQATEKQYQGYPENGRLVH
jgi:hypothetical protein